MQTLLWIKERWYIPLSFIGALALLILAIVLRKEPPDNPMARTKKELAIIDAGTKVRKLEAELGAEKAKQQVAKDYEHAKATMTKAQQEEAEELKDDPKRLAQFLVAAGHSDK